MATTSNTTSTPTSSAANPTPATPGSQSASAVNKNTSTSASENNNPSAAEIARDQTKTQKPKRVEKDETQSIELDKQKKNAELKPIPEIINKRFVSQGDNDKATYFYKDKPDVEAFKDQGKKLSTKSDAQMIAQSMVAVAQSKNWESMKVNGTDKFKRAVWMEANLNGIEVKGYKPSKQDLEQLKQALDNKPKNKEKTEQEKENTVEKTERDKNNGRSPDTFSVKSVSVMSKANTNTAFTQNINDERQKIDKEAKPVPEPVKENEKPNPDSRLAKERAQMDAKLASDKEKLKKIYLTANIEKDDTDGKKRSEVIKKHPELAPVYDLEDAARSFVNHKNNAGKFTDKGKERFISNIREQGINLAATGQKVPEVKSAGKSLVNKEDANQEATR